MFFPHTPLKRRDWRSLRVKEKFRLLLVLLFSVEENFFFRKDNIQLSSRSFFPLPDFAHDAQNHLQSVVSCIIHFNVSSWSGIQSFPVRISLSTIFFTFFRYSSTHSYFIKAENRDFFRQNLGFFDIWVFPRKLSDLRRNCYKSFFPEYSSVSK